MENEMSVDASFPVRLKKYLDQHIVGQEECKKKLVMAVFRHIYFDERNPFLIIGPSGCGKSHMFRILKNCPLMPKDYTIMFYDASRLTPEGVKGEDPQEVIKSYARQCFLEMNMEKKGLIYLDEIDKIIMPSTTSSGENMNATTQYQLMNYIEGEKAFNVDTEKILFVCGGAFTQLDELWKQRKQVNPIGFTKCVEENNSLFAQATIRDDLIEIGAQREFVGRITGIVRNTALTKLQLKALLLHPTRGVIAQKRKSFGKVGLDFSIADEMVDWMVNEAVKENLGARSLHNILDQVLSACEYDMLANGITTMNIDKDVLSKKKICILK